jgi:tetratricopeptide (TPR) repeat protein
MSRTGLILVLALAALCVLAFTPAVGNQFVLWDDDVCFLNNRDFRGLGAAQMGWAWRTTLLGVYQPLGWILHEAEYACWGLNPRGYHAMSLVLHIVNILLLWLLAVHLVRIRLPALAKEHAAVLNVCTALSVALFALHPLRVEAVAWASCQTYLPAVACYLLSVLAYVHYRTTTVQRRRWLALAWACFVLAFLFKAVAVTLPFMMVLLDRLLLPAGPGERRRVWVERLLFFVPLVLFMPITVWARECRMPISSDGLWTRAGFASASVWFYGLKSVVPLGLTHLYFVPHKLDTADIGSWCGVAGLVIAVAVLFVWRRRWPMVWASCWAYLLLLAPSSGLVRSGPQVFADRYSYLPMMAMTVAGAGGIFLLATRVPRLGRIGLAAALVVAAVLVVLSRHQCAVWRDSETLWRHNLAHGGAASPRAHTQLGVSLACQGRSDEALAEFLTAIRLDPDCADAVHDAGLIMVRRRSWPEAEAYFARAVALEPERGQFRFDLGTALVKQGRPEQALPHLSCAERLRPDHCATLVALGHCLGRLGRAAEAIPYLRRAVRVAPSDAEARGYLGIALLVCGADTEARVELMEAVRLDPRQANFRYQLGCLLSRHDDYDAALEQYQEVLRLDPNHQGARSGLDRPRYSPR